MLVFIYTLSDSLGVRYVGKTSDLDSRLKAHLKEAKNKRTRKERWIFALLSSGDFPRMEILEEVDESDWEQAEIYWISQMRSWGFSLLNSTRGGEGSDGFRGKRHSPATIELCRKAARERESRTRLFGASNGRSKLDENKVKLIRSSAKTCVLLSKELGVSRQLVSLVRRGLRWSACT